VLQEYHRNPYWRNLFAEIFTFVKCKSEVFCLGGILHRRFSIVQIEHESLTRVLVVLHLLTNVHWCNFNVLSIDYEAIFHFYNFQCGICILLLSRMFDLLPLQVMGHKILSE